MPTSKTTHKKATSTHKRSVSTKKTLKHEEKKEETVEKPKPVEAKSSNTAVTSLSSLTQPAESDLSKNKVANDVSTIKDDLDEDTKFENQLKSLADSGDNLEKSTKFESTPVTSSGGKKIQSMVGGIVSSGQSEKKDENPSLSSPDLANSSNKDGDGEIAFMKSKISDEFTSNPASQVYTSKAMDMPNKVNSAGGSSSVSNGSTRIKMTDGSQQNHKLAIIIIAILILVIGAISFYYFKISNIGSFKNPLRSTDSDSSGIVEDDKSDKYENPLNGELINYSEALKFKDLKPIAVMVNNYVEARPSYGLSSADVVYEAVAEAGITRLMPIFFSKIPEKVESVRSARYYFAELAAPYNPHFIHWGAAHVPACQKDGSCPPVNGKVETLPETDAYDRIVKLGLPNLDGGNYACDGANCVFTRDQERISKGYATEHTAYVRLPKVYELAKQIRPQDSWHNFIKPNLVWSFKEDATEADRGSVGATTPITYIYWDTQPAFNVKWTYDKTSNLYTRYQGGEKQIDALSNKDLQAKVVIVRMTKETPANDKKAHLLHDIVGTGEAYIFQDGKVTKGTWSRTTYESMDVYKDASGNEIKFNRGQIWVQVVPSENKITYEAATPVSTTTP